MTLQSLYQSLISSVMQAEQLLISTISVELIEPAVYLFIAICGFAAVAALLGRSVKLISQLQKTMYRKPWDYTTKRKIEVVLRFSKPNTGWILALCLYSLCQAWQSNIGVRLFSELLFIYATYKCILLITTYSIERAYKSTGKYTSETKLKELYKAGKSTVGKFIALIAINQVINLIMTNAYLVALYYLFSTVAIAYLYIQLLKPHKEAAIKFILSQLPSSFEEYVSKRYAEREVDSVFLPIFLTAHAVNIFLIIHNFLLRFDMYRLFATRMLRMRLEQKMQNEKSGDVEEEVVIDEKYEKWFSSLYQPQNFVHTENGRFAKELTDETVNNWLCDKAAENDLLFIGAAGSGKTSLIKYWIEITELEVPIHYHSINPKALHETELYILLSQILNIQISSIEDLIAYDKDAEKCVIVLDNVHNLFLSNIGGFQCYKLLLECLNAQLENIFWIVLLNDLSYTYLNDVFGHMQQYSHKVELRPWSVAEIRDLIMSRHKASKRKLAFDELLFSSLGSDELSAYSATADRCFRILWEQSSGNPLLAMAIWVKAASKKERFTIEVGLPERPSGQIFNEFTADSLFIYSALVRHGNLTQDEAARSTRLSPSIARRAFKLGRDYGFLINMTNDRFCIHPLWMSTIISFLKNKNYLHGK